MPNQVLWDSNIAYELYEIANLPCLRRKKKRQKKKKKKKDPFHAVILFRSRFISSSQDRNAQGSRIPVETVAVVFVRHPIRRLPEFLPRYRGILIQMAVVLKYKPPLKELRC
ncbi:hypothetical protein PUN28_019071 [Cardiocondyla obscurior]|uniref:Uncharacterized protein n=1 Tax=Cardiocondyla obscurior TaxID=286306 RepID=A0AAW2EFZ2_9HYME